MADSKYGNLARKPEFHENDPFAELTRIIGFDPEGARPLSGNGGQNDLGIDLEKELLGEYDEIEASSIDADALAWDAHEAEVPEAEVLAAANDADAAEAADDEPQEFDVAEDPYAAEDSYAAEDEVIEAVAAEDLSVGDEDLSVGDVADQEFDFEAELDDELAREAENWMLDEQAEPDSLEPLEFDAPAQAAHDALEAVRPVAEVEPVAEEQDEATAGEADELEFLDMDFSDFEEAAQAVEQVALDPVADQELPQPVANGASIAEPSIEDELAALLGSFPPSEAQEAEEQLRHDPADYDFGDIFADGAAQLEAAVTEQEEVEAEDVEPVAEWQPAEDAGWIVEETAAQGPVAEPATEAVAASASVVPFWQRWRGQAQATEPVADNDAMDNAAEVVVEEEPALSELEQEPSEAAPAEPAPAERDPFAELAAMAAAPMPQFQRVNLSFAAAPRQDEAHLQPAAQEEPAAEDLAPQTGVDEDDLVIDIDSVEIPEEAVAVADDLDLPEIDYQEKSAAAPQFDDFEHEFSALFADQQPAEPAVRPGAAADPVSYPEDELRAAVDRIFEDESEPIAVRPYEPAPAAAATASVMAFSQAAAAPRPAEAAHGESDLEEEFGYDPDLQEQPAPAKSRLAVSRRSLMAAAAALAGVVIVGGAGFLFFGDGGPGSSAPVIVRADDGPVKIRPENPGGTTVPNQNREVYERVTSGPTEAAPAQEKLVSTVEEPIDVATRIPAAPAKPAAAAATEKPADAAKPAVAEKPAAAEVVATAEAGSPPPMVDDLTIPMKSEERLAPSPSEEEAEADDIALVTPRKVRTFVVRPDGTMVPSEPPVQEAALPAGEADSAAATMRQAEPVASAGEAEAAQPAAGPEQPQGGQETVAAAAPAAAAQGTEAAAEAAAQPAGVVTPASVPIAPPRPADQPVEIVGEVRRDQVAAAQPQNQNTAAAGGWSMQIASQPSAEGAQATYAALASRYGEVIGGRGVNIVKAEVTGKGTYYRVRVPAGSRSEAIELCERYKSAGGSCFVSQ